MLTKEELLRFANIFDNAGQVFLGVMVLSPLVAGVDTKTIKIIVLGLAFTLFCWWLSVRLTKEVKKYDYI